MKSIFTLILFCLSYQLMMSQTRGQSSESSQSLAKNMDIVQISPSVYLLRTFQTVDGFGTFTSNGMVYVVNGECMLFDTPPEAAKAEVLIRWIEDSLKAKIVGVVVNHFHKDCLGGLNAFHKRFIPSYSSSYTQYLANRDSISAPLHTFNSKLVLFAGGKRVILDYLGGAHTDDNIIAYIPSEKVLFGGCMVKSLGSNRGNTEHANLFMWPETVKKVRRKYKSAECVVPGHGRHGGLELLDYTIRLFAKD